MKYWIIIDGVTEGPVDLDEIIRRNLPGKTPVWRNGLTDWAYLETLPEWIERQQAAEAQAAPTIEVEEVVIEPSDTQASYQEPRNGHAAPPPLNASAAPQPKMSHPWGERHVDTTGEPAPTYLGWSIAAAVVCCTVLGIVAIVYAMRVRDENRRGYYAEAQRDSRTVELWLIASITLGIVALPFNIIFALL